MPTIKRETLFNRIWQTPAYKLAPELGLSGRGLAKVCQRFAIPMPPIGYFWEPMPQNEHGRFNAGTPRSACVPFHKIILERLEAGDTFKAIHEHLKTFFFPGSLCAVQEYCGKLLRGQKRTITSRNRFKEFKMNVTVGSRKPYEVQQPALPPGPEFVIYKEPFRIAPNEGFTPYQLQPRCDQKELGPDEPPPAEGPLAVFQAELTYAREKFPELFVMWWFEIGADLPTVAYKTLDWSQVRDDGKKWAVHVRTALGRNTTAKVSPEAADALRPFRRTTGHVFTNARTARRARNHIAMIAGPEWRRHLMALREELGTR